MQWERLTLGTMLHSPQSLWIVNYSSGRYTLLARYSMKSKLSLSSTLSLTFLSLSTIPSPSNFSSSLSLYLYLPHSHSLYCATSIIQSDIYKSQWNLPYLGSLRCLPGICVERAQGCSRPPVTGTSPAPNGILNQQSPEKHNRSLNFY